MIDGNKIREIRLSKGITQLELAFDINSSKAHISKIENGHTKKPRISTLIKIAEALDVDVEDFYIIN